MSTGGGNESACAVTGLNDVIPGLVTKLLDRKEYRTNPKAMEAIRPSGMKGKAFKKPEHGTCHQSLNVKISTHGLERLAQMSCLVTPWQFVVPGSMRCQRGNGSGKAGLSSEATTPKMPTET